MSSGTTGSRTLDSTTTATASTAGPRLVDALVAHAPRARLVLLGSAAEYGVVGHGTPLAEDGPANPVAAYGITKLASTGLVRQAVEDGRLDGLAELPHRVAVIDLARDGKASYFTAEEIGELRDSGKKVLAYFEIGSIEDFRPDFVRFRMENPDLMLNEWWPDWPGEYFVEYWDERWWDAAVRPRLDRALAAGFDGAYLDTPLAYEEIDLDLVPGEDRNSLGRKMVNLIVRISEYTKAKDPDFWVFPQNSPELRKHGGYTEAIDGIGWRSCSSSPPTGRVRRTSARRT